MVNFFSVSFPLFLIIEIALKFFKDAHYSFGIIDEASSGKPPQTIRFPPTTHLSDPELSNSNILPLRVTNGE